MFVERTGTATLQRGPGNYSETAFPGQEKTIGIAGHRTTYFAPFRKINDVTDGHEIVVEMPYGTFTYVVGRSEIVKPSAIEVVDNTGASAWSSPPTIPCSAPRSATYSSPTL